jgi:hypothetical protein
LFDAACSRYGWTYDYVLDGISLINLQMMMLDQVSILYTPEEDKKKVGRTDKDRKFNASNANIKEIRLRMGLPPV